MAKPLMSELLLLKEQRDWARRHLDAIVAELPQVPAGTALGVPTHQRVRELRQQHGKYRLLLANLIDAIAPDWDSHDPCPVCLAEYPEVDEEHAPGCPFLAARQALKASDG